MVGLECRAGENVKFWTDIWVQNLNPLHEYVVCPFPEADLGKAILEYVTASGEWNWDWIKRYLTADIC